MRKSASFVVLLALVMLVLSAGVTPLMADDGGKAEAVERLATLAKKYVELAEAIPADKYTWRPGEGVMSVSEVLMHVTFWNYGIPEAIGTPPPEGYQFPPEGIPFRGYDKSATDRAEVVGMLKASFEHATMAFDGVDDAGKAVKLFGQDTTARGTMWNMLGHLSEHFGQMIAYARVNGVTPPWSAK